MRRTRDSACVAALAIVLAIGLVAGCADTGGRVAVSGSVKFQDKPLDKGTIEFAAKDGSCQSGGQIVNGTYTVAATRGLMPGMYIVRISAVQESGAAAANAPPGPESMAPTGRETIPAEYNTNSKLTAEVTPRGANKFDFELK